MREEVTRWPAVVLSYAVETDGIPTELHCRIDLKPDTGKAKGVMIWRTNGQGKNHDLDKALDRIGRKISRVIQGRAP